MLEKYLLDIGLSLKEIAVYMASLELGESTVIDIAKKSDVNRTTIYPIIDSLKEKGLLSLIQKGKKQYFYAESPNKIRSFVDSKINELEASKESLPEVIKQLGAFENRRGDKPVVRFYEGDDGVNSMLEEFITGDEKVSDPNSEDNKIFISYSRDLQESLVSKEQRDYRRNIRNQSGVKSIYLYNKKEGELISDELRKRIKVDSKIYPFPAHIAVFKDRIRFISYTKKMGILIIDSELAETLRSIMKLATKAGEKQAK